jgi:heme/copper-type cytochrome/quinol oxidase subunit 4
MRCMSHIEHVPDCGMCKKAEPTEKVFGFALMTILCVPALATFVMAALALSDIIE